MFTVRHKTRLSFSKQVSSMHFISRSLLSPPFTKAALCVPFFMFSTLATAAPVVGGTATVNNGDAVESWFLSQSATLNVNDAQTLAIDADNSAVNINAGSSTQGISASNSSTVNISSATVTGTGGQTGLELVSSQGNINNSTVSGDFFGLTAVRFSSTQTGSTVNVTDSSTITGADAGAFATSHSLINVTDSVLEGTATTGYGLWLQSADAVAKNSTITGGQNGVFIELDVTGVAPVTLNLDNTTVQGKAGSAIVVDFDNVAASMATLTLNNATLLAGNDTLLEVKGGATTSMTVNASTLNGNIVTETGSTTDVTLQNNSSLTGRLVNVASATINDTSQWGLVDNSQVDKLVLNGGTVKFGDKNAFYQLNVTDLSGNGLFIMGTDLATGRTDLLNVTGTADHRCKNCWRRCTIVTSQQRGSGRLFLCAGKKRQRLDSGSEHTCYKPGSAFGTCAV
jgi:hypothetical protein